MKRAPIGSMLLVAVAIVLLIVGSVQIPRIQDRCDRAHGILVRSHEGFWGYSCIEKGQH